MQQHVIGLGSKDCKDIAPVLDQRIVAKLRVHIKSDDLRAMLAMVAAESAQCLNRIQSACAEGTPTAAVDAAHALRGMASNFGAARVASLAASIEASCSAGTSIDPGMLRALEAAVCDTDVALRNAA